MDDNQKKTKEKNPNQIEAGIVKVGDDLYNIRVSRRMSVSEFAPSRQFFRRRNRVKGLNQARRVKRELLDELSMEALKYEGKDVKWKVAREDYHKHLEARHREGSLAYSTMRNALDTIDKHTQAWDEKWLSTFSHDFIEGFITEEKLRNELEPATRQAILKFIRGVFKRQIVVGRLKNDPTAGLAVKTKKKRSYPTVMTQDEVFRVIDYAKSIEANWAKEWAYVYEIAYYTGARSGELYALAWADVELDSIGPKRIYIKKSYDWKTETLKNTKGKSDRVVPVNKDLEKVLRELKKKYPNAEYVLPRIPDWKQGKSAEQLKAYQRDLGIKPTKFHSIRASTITNLLLNSMPLVKVQALVGHEEIQTTILYLASIGDEVQGVTDCLSREDNVVKADFKAKKAGKR